jgi:hypothetical protein
VALAIAACKQKADQIGQPMNIAWSTPVPIWWRSRAWTRPSSSAPVEQGHDVAAAGAAVF